ncbi:MAG TPA: ATP-binding protein [Candidatus Aquicultoraceae bacterium]|nr:ATP-binding protein [Candidatus Aquicultoraceae bacterium]
MGNPIPLRGTARTGFEPAHPGTTAAAVSRIARICALGLALDELLGESCREIAGLLGVDACYLVAYRERGGGAEIRHFAGSPERPDLRAMYGPSPRWEPSLERLRAHGLLAVDDLLELPPDDPVRILHEPHAVRSLLLAPLGLGTGLLGLLALHRYGAPRAWGAEGIALAGDVVPILSAVLERRRTEERLRASEAAYRILAENAPDFLSLHGTDGAYRYASPSVHRMLGFRPEEVAGCRGDAFLHPDDRAAAVEADRRLVTGETASVTTRQRLRRKDGEYREVETVSSIVPGLRGEDPRIVRVTRDLSERRATAGRPVDDAGRNAIGTLAGGLAHEFNNLLLGIEGAAEMLSLMLAGNQEAAGYLATIERMGDRAAELTRQLLAYAGRGRYGLETVSVNRLLHDYVPALKATLPPSVEVRLELGDGLPAIRADVPRLKQLVMNLCRNAAEAMPDGGPLTLRTRTGEGGPGAGLVLEVSDRGAGMDAGTLSRIFEPFFSTKFIGRGMGLAAVRGIVEAHGGTVRAASEAGRGTTVSVVFPAADEPPPEEGGTEPLPRSGTGTILVADDQDDVRTMLRAMLESFGYRVLEARDGREAVGVFRENGGGVDLVLLDMMMPGLTGEEAFAEIRRISPSARGLLVSGYDERGRIGEVVASGFSGFLQKPFRRRELGRKVSEAMGDAPPEERSDGP